MEMVEELQARRDDLYREIEDLLDRREQIKKDLDQEEDRLAAHKGICQEIIKMEEQRNLLMEDCGRLATHLETLEEQRGLLQKDILGLEEDLHGKKKDLDHGEKRVLELEEQFQSRRQLYAGELAKLEDRVAEKGKELKYLYDLLLRAKDRLRSIPAAR